MHCNLLQAQEYAPASADGTKSRKRHERHLPGRPAVPDKPQPLSTLSHLAGFNTYLKPCPYDRPWLAIQNFFVSAHFWNGKAPCWLRNAGRELRCRRSASPAPLPSCPIHLHPSANSGKRLIDMATRQVAVALTCLLLAAASVS